MKVTIIWPNHNSRHSIEKVFESLRCIAKQRYSNFELIIVDDGSIDGSDKLIYRFIKEEKLFNDIPEIKFVKLSKSYGFTGAVNAGYRARSKDSQYVVIHNNDACMYDYALESYVKILEEYELVGALQGIILNAYNLNIVDSAGGYLVLRVPSTYLEVIHLRGIDVNTLRRLILKYSDEIGVPISFFEGTLPIIRIEAVKKALGSYGDRNLFITSAKFYYLEDILLSLLIWCNGFRVYLIDKPVGYHYRSLVLKSISTSSYFRHITVRNYSALREMIVRDFAPKLHKVLDLLFIIRSLLKGLKIRDPHYIYSVVEGMKFYNVIAKVLGKRRLNAPSIPIIIRFRLT